MKTLILMLFLYVAVITYSFTKGNAGIERAVLDQVEGFYYGDTLKIMRSVHPDLSKYAWLRNNDFTCT